MAAAALVTAAAELVKRLRTVTEGSRLRAQRAGGASHARQAGSNRELRPQERTERQSRLERQLLRGLASGLFRNLLPNPYRVAYG
jgi:hypothetical protein